MLTIYFLSIALLSVAYLSIMAFYRSGWKALPTWQIPNHFQPSTQITVIIPARNEAENIRTCLTSIARQSYPSNLYEVIVVDDHSTDATPSLVEKFKLKPIQLIRLAAHTKPNTTYAFKKRAIELAIAQSTGALIVTTDADCVVQPDWLKLIASFYETHQLQFIAAPVNFYQEKNAFERFQSLDFVGMMGITGAGIHTRLMRMCNGANLAYPKTAFYEVNGFEGINHLASGDDMLLMQKIAAKYPHQIGYLKNKAATTYTQAKPTLRTFVNQRIRWATKSNAYQERQVTVILALVWLFCVSIFVNLLLSLWIGWMLVAVAFAQFIVKGIADWRLLAMMSRFFDRSDLMKGFGLSSLYHWMYIVVIGFLGGVVKEYEWKGRKVK